MTDKPECELIGQNGNIYNLMAIARKCLEKARKKQDGVVMTDRIVNDAQSYDEALKIISEYVEIV